MNGKIFTLSWDACHTSDKVQYNYHTCETRGFADDAFDLKRLASEFKNMGCVDNHDAVFLKKEQNRTYSL